MYQLRSIIRAELHIIAVEIRALKRWWRTPVSDRPAPPVTRFPLVLSKRRATLLCTIMAHSRGRLHAQSTASLADQHEALCKALDAMEGRTTPLIDAQLRATARAILVHHRDHFPQACVAPTAEHRA